MVAAEEARVQLSCTSHRAIKVGFRADCQEARAGVIVNNS